jgi:hypothetical protein
MLPLGRRSRRVGVMSDTKKPLSKEPSALEWLEKDCPNDVVSRVLSFCRPQVTANLGKSSRFWKQTLDNEATWKVLCEEQYKWKEGDPEPASWKTYYRLTPCVPIDYFSIPSAIASITSHTATRRSGNSSRYEQRISARILLRPGHHVLHQSITVHAAAGVEISFETMKLPASILRSSHARLLALAEQQQAFDNDDAAAFQPSASKRPKLPPSFRKLLRRNRGESLDGTERMDSFGSIASAADRDMDNMNAVPTRATLSIRSRHYNEPVFWVRRGHAILRDIDVEHFSPGLDIWQGNAAIQLQPFYGVNNEPVLLSSRERPSASLFGVKVTSSSGRGIVCIDGGRLEVFDSAVHDCAATGVYIGGPGSKAHLERSDFMRNGAGNAISRRGIARGHSGVYLEQGFCRIVDCNISANTLTGISAVSPENAVLHLSGSHLVRNGSYQVEIPPLNTPARNRSVTENNITTGTLYRVRSGLLEDENEEANNRTAI